ncbi:hypothetical protein Tcan_03922 [Toxocara canis]|uniref:Uncharacterized protein n=1 Tax=Toxocara canis TaxID=6265 RepID=A0A0B2VN32_TOXCA|nr:hypothetical protein Tcan_03922 [Toxocara canis]
MASPLMCTSEKTFGAMVYARVVSTTAPHTNILPSDAGPSNPNSGISFFSWGRMGQQLCSKINEAQSSIQIIANLCLLPHPIFYCPSRRNKKPSNMKTDSAEK